MPIDIHKFDGPLDLLLSLIEDQKLDISTISLSKITDQYLDYLKKGKNRELPELISFVEMATRLIILKSRLLLPYLYINSENDDGEELVKELKQYQQFLRQARKLQKYVMNYEIGCVHQAHSLKIITSLNTIEKELSVIKIHKKMQKLAAKMLILQQPITTIKKVFNIKEKIRELINFLHEVEMVYFSKLPILSPSRGEIIINFLSVLELYKAQVITLHQESIFEEIHITVMKDKG